MGASYCKPGLYAHGGRTASQVSGRGSHVPEATRATLSFGKDVKLVKTSRTVLKEKGLLRAVPSDQVITAFGKRLQNSDPSAEHFNISKEVNSLNEFISHNWSVPRRMKFLVLALRYNYQASMVILVVVWASCFTLTVLDVLPTVDYLDESREEVRPIGLFCTFAPMCCFLPSLFIVHEILPRSLSRRVFLDKCCIHQVNDDLQRQGIGNLAGFISSSEKMLVVFGPEYLRKLWTVYELACFLLTRDTDLTIIPVFLPWVVIFGQLCWSLYNVLKYYVVLTVATTGGPTGILTVLSVSPILVVFPFFVVCRSWARTLEMAENHTTNFSIQHAVCSHDQDRPILENNIWQLIVETGLMPAGTALPAALRCFDERVRSAFPDALRRTLGPSTVQYRYIAVMFLSSSGNALDVFAADVRSGQLDTIAVLRVLQQFLVTLCFCPLMAALFLVIGRSCLSLRGAAEQVYLFGVSSLALVLMYAIWRFDSILLSRSAESSTAVIAKLALEVAVTAATICMYRGCHMPGRSPSSASESDCESRSTISSDDGVICDPGSTSLFNTAPPDAPWSTELAI